MSLIQKGETVTRNTIKDKTGDIIETMSKPSEDNEPEARAKRQKVETDKTEPKPRVVKKANVPVAENTASSSAPPSTSTSSRSQADSRRTTAKPNTERQVKKRTNRDDDDFDIDPASFPKP